MTFWDHKLAGKDLKPVPVKAATAPNTLKTFSEPTKLVVKKEVTPQQDVMSFLKSLSTQIKNEAPKLPETISERIDAYIRDHGNRHPETTKAI